MPARTRLLRTAFPVFAIALTLAACTTVGPDYQRPTVELPARYATGTGVQPAKPGLPDAAGVADWWTLFADPDLDRLVQTALARNTDLQVAAARIEEADALAREAGAAMLPALNLGASGGRFRSRNLLVPGSSYQLNNVQVNALASYEIDFWGRLRRASEAARAQALATRDAGDVMRLTITGATAQAWFSLRSLDEQIRLTADTLLARNRQLELLMLKLDAGSASRLELEQASIARTDSQIQLRDLQRQRELARTLLGRLTGQPALSIDAGPPTPELTRLPIPPMPPLGLPSDLLSRRPDLRQAEQQLIAANAQIGVAKAALLPSISLTGSYGAQSTALASLLDPQARIWSLGFALSLPIFDGGRLQARVDQASARERQALATYQGAAQTAFREVSDALIAGSAAREQEQLAANKLRASQQALELATLRHEAGYSSYLEVLDAQRSANAAGLDRVRNRQAALNATVELFKALSGGWLPTQ